jgi:predicted Zn-dependent protease
MAKRRLNKNLVAFLTAAGIILAVVVVGIATLNAARRDPAAVAEKARGLEEAGDLPRAVGLYRRAYDLSKEAKYLLEAARCARELGELPDMFNLLNYAQAQSPRDPDVLQTLLVRYWEIREYRLGQDREVLEHAESLLELDPDNVLALVSKSEALRQLQDEDPTFASEAEATLQRAMEIDPTSPFAALVQAERVRTRASAQAAAASQQGRSFEAEAILKEAGAERARALQPAVAAHPDNTQLRVALAETLVADAQWDDARTLLEQGLASQPEEADLRHAMAAFLFQQAQDKQDEVSADEIAALVNEGLEHVRKALELEPALYMAYTLRADLQRLSWTASGRWEADPLECQKTILESFAEALRNTVGLRTIRARLGRGQRLQMIARAFDSALQFHRDAGADDAGRAQALTYLRRFFQEAQAQYPEHAVVPLMEGHLALIDGDQRLAIKSFTEAEKRGDPGPFGQLAKEELTRLYRRVEEFGLSLRYARELIDRYEVARRQPPRWLRLHEAELLIALDQAQEALDVLDSIASAYPEDASSKTIRARALALLGRGDEGMQILEESPSDDPRVLLGHARIAVFNEEYDTAVRLLRQVLQSNPDSLGTIRLLMQVLLAADRADEAAQLIQDRIDQTGDERVRRSLQTYQVMLSTPDPEQRRQRLLEILAEIPDDFERAAEHFNFWVAQQDLERAVTHLDEMERLRPNDPDVLRLQFDTALRLQNCPRAEQYASRLAQTNADLVGGALFRGRYELSCGAADKALSEFRAAERELPTDPELKMRIAQALLLLKPPRYDAAIQALEQAVEFDPRSFAAHKLLYICYERTGRRSEGISHLEKAADLNPDDALVKESTRLLEEEKDPRRGIAWREPFREENPNDVANLLRLAELYERIGDDVRAEERLQAAVQIDPANVQAARFGASFYARHDDRAAGEKLLQEHLTSQVGLPSVVARVLFGRFYETLGDPEAALIAYQQAHQSVDQALTPGSADHRRAVVITASELAEFYRRTQRFPEMIDAYRVVLAHLDPDNVSSAQATRRSIIYGLLSARRFGEAEQEIAAYRNDYPKDPRGMMAEAEFLMARRKVDEARDLLSRVLETQPNHPWSLYMRGRINLEQRRYPEARADLLAAKAAAPEAFNLNHRLDLARLYVITEQPELAEAELRELLPLERDTRTVELRLIELLRNNDQVAKAQEFVNELIARQPEEPFWHYQLGRLLSARGEYSAAVGPLKTAVDLAEGAAPNTVADWLRALIRSNRAREATRAYESLDPQLVTPRIQAYAAEAYLAEDRRDVGVALLEQAVSSGSVRSLRELRSAVTHAVILLGKTDGLAVLRRVLEHPAGDAAALALQSTLARYLVVDKEPARRQEGLEMTEAVIAAAQPGSPLHVEALLVKALALEQAEQNDQAVQVYEEVLRVAPDNAHALNNIAYILADKLGRPAEALPYAERLREVAPENANILDTVGWVYFKNGKVDEAEVALLEGLRMEPDNLVARHHLGQLYADSGKRATAQRTFRRLLESASKQENAEDPRVAAEAKDFKKKAEEALASLR